MAFGLGICAALAIGTALGLFGAGGSILAMPILHYLFGIDVHTAITMSSLVVAVTSLSAAIPHVRARRVRGRVVLVFGAASMVAAFGAGVVSRHIPAGTLLVAFTTVMAIAGIAMVRPHRPRPARGSTRWLVALGLAVGAITGFVGAGGGFLVVPALVMIAGMAFEEAIATSLVVIAINATVSVVGTAGAARIDGRNAAILGLVLGLAVLGSAIGHRIARRVERDRLRRWFGWFVLVVALGILGVEGLSLA